MAKEGLFPSDSMAVSSQREPRCCPSQKWGAPGPLSIPHICLSGSGGNRDNFSSHTGAEGKRVEPGAGLGFQFALVWACRLGLTRISKWRVWSQQLASSPSLVNTLTQRLLTQHRLLRDDSKPGRAPGARNTEMNEAPQRSTQARRHLSTAGQRALFKHLPDQGTVAATVFGYLSLTSSVIVTIA